MIDVHLNLIFMILDINMSEKLEYPYHKCKWDSPLCSEPLEYINTFTNNDQEVCK